MVKLNDVTLRDGQQSLLSGRVQQADLLAAAKATKNLPYNMLEVWGGTCFDMPLKEKGENPFQNLREFREELGEGANLSMLLRCQNLVGYEGHDMSIVQSFIEEAAKPFGHDDARMGINTFRIFDSLNDMENLTPVIKAVRALKDERGWNVSAQGTLSYTVIDDKQRKDVIEKGGDAELYTPAYYVKLAKQMVEAGAESICIKDMAGLIDADHARALVTALKNALPNTPIVLHAQSGLGLSDGAILAAIEAGVDEVDVCSKAMAGGAGHSATEDILAMMQKRCPDRIPEGFDAEKLEACADTWRSIRPKYARFENPHDPELQKLVQESQVPGGMTTTLRAQISGALKDPDEINLFLKATLMEMTRVRADVGYITLVTPSSQVVGTQAIAHVNQVFHQLKADGELSLDNIKYAITENRENGTYLQAMTPAFAKLVEGQLGALPYQPAEEIVSRAQEIVADQKPLANLDARKAELRTEIEGLLNPENLSGISDERRLEMLQRRGHLSERTKAELERIAYEPTAQELLMYAIKPVSTTKEQQQRLNALIHQIHPQDAEKLGYGADAPAQLSDTQAALSNEQQLSVEKAATSMLDLIRVKQDGVVLPVDERNDRIARTQESLSTALAEIDRDDPTIRDALKERFDTFGLAGAMHYIGKAVSTAVGR